MLRMGLCFILIEAHSILPSPSGGFSTLLMLCSLFLRKVILLTMLAVNVFSSISNKKKQIANVIVRLRSFSYLFLNILKGITTQKDRTERLICLRQMKQKLYIGSRQNSLLPLKKLYFFVSTYLTIVHFLQVYHIHHQMLRYREHCRGLLLFQEQNHFCHKLCEPHMQIAFDVHLLRKVRFRDQLCFG